MNTQIITETLENDTDAVLIAFTDALEKGGASLVDWSERYPGLGRDFARLAAQSFAGIRGTVAESTNVERLQSVALAALRKQKSAYFATQPLMTLVDKERGITAAKLAQTTLLPVPFIAKLNQRLFIASTVPGELIARIAEAIGRTVDDVASYLSGPPLLARAAAYRSDDAPIVGEPEDFSKALLTDRTIPQEIRDLYASR